MSVHVLGPTRTLTHTCEIIGTYRGYAGTNPTFTPGGPGMPDTCNIGTGIAGASGTSSGQVTTFFGGDVTWAVGVFAGNDYGWVLRARALNSRPYDSVDLTETYTPPRNITGTLAATMTATCEVELCMEVLTPDDTDTIDGEEFPNFGGAAVGDHLQGYRIRLFERTIADSEVSIEIEGTMGSTTQTASDSFTVTTPFEVGYEVILNHELQSVNWLGVSEIESTWMPSTLPDETTTESNSDEYAKSTISKSGSVVTTRLDTAQNTVTDACHLLANGQMLLGDGEAVVSYAPDEGYDFAAELRAFGSAYPDSLDVSWEGGDGTDVLNGTSVSDTRDERRYYFYRVLLGINQGTINIDERGYQRCWLSSFGAEDSSDWRMQFRGYRWTAATLEHEAETELDDGSSSTGWSGGANTTYSNVGGAQRAVVSGGAGSLTYTPASDENCEAYRFLRVRIKATGANKPFTVNLSHTEGEDKSYSAETGSAGTYADVDLDLCNPDSMPDTVDEQYSRWPLKYFGLPPENSEQQWGFNLFDELSITGLEDGQTYEIDKISLVRDDHAYGTLLPAFTPWEEAWESDTDFTYQKPFWWSEVDGRIADRSAMFRVVPKSAGSPSLDWYTITETLGQISANQGWTVGAGSSPSDGFHGASREGFLLFGSGAVYDFSTDTWDYGVDVDYTTQADLVAQMLWDEVRGVPQAGDAWIGGSYGGRLKLRTVKFLRGGAWGLVFDSGGPTSGETIEIKTEPGGAGRGSDTTDVLGWGVTGTPWSQDGSHRIHATGQSTTPFDSYNRMRRRAAFVEIESGGAVAYCTHQDGMHYRSYINGDGKIVSERSDNLLSWAGTTTTIDADYLHLSHSFDGYPRVFLQYTEGGVVYLREAPDGVTWGMATTVSTGTSNEHSARVNLPGGRSFSYWIDSTGTIRGREMDAAGNTIGTAGFSTTITGVDSVGFMADRSDYGQGRVRVAIQCTVSGVLTQYLSTDGRTFS